MRRVAEAVGVRGPSLYKRVPDRAALLRAIADAVVADLADDVVRRSTSSEDPGADLAPRRTAYRAFVRANPNGYRLLFSALPAGGEPGPGGPGVAR